MSVVDMEREIPTHPSHFHLLWFPRVDPSPQVSAHKKSRTRAGPGFPELRTFDPPLPLLRLQGCRPAAVRLSPVHPAPAGLRGCRAGAVSSRCAGTEGAVAAFALCPVSGLPLRPFGAGGVCVESLRCQGHLQGRFELGPVSHTLRPLRLVRAARTCWRQAWRRWVGSPRVRLTLYSGHSSRTVGSPRSAMTRR